MRRGFVLVVCGLAGCGRVAFEGRADATDATNATDASPDDTAVPPCPVTWQQTVQYNELQAAVGAGVEDPTVSADRRMLAFATAASGGVGGKDLWMATRAASSGPFNTPVNLTALNSALDESSPELSPDGNTIYFVSTRSGSSDVYTATRSGNSWQAPTVVAALTTSSNGELEIAVSPDGLTAMVNRDGQMTLYTRPTTSVMFGAGTIRSELDITTDVASPSLTSTAVYYHLGTVRDMYVACRNPDNTFGKPAPITSLNTTNRDADPFVLDGDGVMFYTCVGDICEAAAVP